MNFFVAAMQTAFAAFVTVYLVRSQWTPQAIGFADRLWTMDDLIALVDARARALNSQ
jgi:hypothetical protein